MKHMRNGFTLIEMLGVITLLALISVIIIMVIDKNLKDSKNVLSSVQIENIKSAASMWRTDNISSVPAEGYYVMTLGDLIDSGYIDDVVDPKNNESFDKGLLISIGLNNITINDNYYVLKYIECTGGQYIDTGFKTDNNTKIEIDFDSKVSEKWLFGSRTADTSTDSYGVYFDSNTQYFVRIGGDTNNSSHRLSNVSTLGRHKIYATSSSFTVDNTSTINFAADSTVSTSNLYVGAMNNTTNVDDRRFIGKIYSVKIWDDTVLSRNLLPSRRNSDGAVGLYDSVNGVFYPNVGYGTFIYGELD